jgi:hypothetical protein
VEWAAWASKANALSATDQKAASGRPSFLNDIEVCT